MAVYSRRRYVSGAVTGSIVVLALAGCGWSGEGRYTPTDDEARSSLESALTAWCEGRAPSQVEATPPVRVVDSGWLAGQQVHSFQILRGDVGDYGTKRFTVRLSMKKPKGDREVGYILHGRNPVWVYREEDFERTMNMDNNPMPRRRRR